MSEDFDEPRCPTCGAGSVPIFYGYPDKAAMAAAEAGDLAFGGCVVREEMPAWQCRTDPGHRWGGRRLH
jgi:hypothetical protein